MSRCIHVYPFVARNHGGIPFSGVCPNINSNNNNNDTHNVICFMCLHNMVIKRKFIIKEREYLPNSMIVLTLHMYGHKYSKRRINRVRLLILLVVS